MPVSCGSTKIGHVDRVNVMQWYQTISGVNKSNKTICCVFRIARGALLGLKRDGFASRPQPITFDHMTRAAPSAKAPVSVLSKNR